MKITEKEIKESTAKVEVLIPTDRVDHVKEEVVDEMIKNVTVKGFRQGKAPRNIAEQNLSPEKLNNHIISHLLNEAVTKILKEKKYHTLGRPVLEKLETTKEGEVQLVMNFPLYPEFKLGRYKDRIKKAKIKDKNVESIYDLLLKNISIEVSPLLVEEEVSHALSRLEEQAKSLNITLEKYFESIKKTKEEVQKDYEKNALESIKLDLILLTIAKEEKLKVSDEEIQSLSQLANAKSDQIDQIKSILLRRKTIDFLKDLTSSKIEK